MARVLRGDVFWADLNPVRGQEQANRRAVLVISHDVFNERSGTVIAMAITSQPQRTGFPLTMAITEPGMSRRSWLKMSQVRTLSVVRLGGRITSFSSEFVNQAIDGLNETVAT